ncbi:unnamed protein product [Fraxinus pennsylvanica]|uniref:Uncharacterized protein n=1 Tax=Fraxinus pennsylvanica TaxID=56036 RepID=A0AAD2DMR6_9LAMI|nr:unnamed protein product [Fraxinus pennsylvanica]
MCNEVDGFINKETVKYVENQVQYVGSGVKRFYSNVVQDILPPLEDIVNSEEWSMQQGSVDTQRNNDTMMPSQLDHSVQCTTTPSADPCEEAETDLPLEQDGDGIISNNSDKVVVETRDTSGDHNNTTLSMVSSLAPPVHEARLITFPEEGIFSKRFSDDIECSSDISSTGWDFELDLPEIEDSNFDDDRSLSAPRAVSVDGHEDNVLVIDSSSSSADDVDCRTPEKEKPLSDNLSNEVEHFNASSTVLPPELDLPEVEDSNFDEDGRLSVPQAVSIDKGQKYNVQVMDSSSSSADDADCRTSEKDIPLSHNLSTEVECFNASSTIQQPELDLPEVEYSNFDEDGSSSVPQGVSVDKGEKCNGPTINSPTTSADDADCGTTEKDGSLSDNFSTVVECFNASSTVQSPEIVVSTFSCENKVDNGVISSSCAASPESSNFLELTLADLVQKAKDIFDPRADSIDCIYNKSDDHKCSASLTTAACETKTLDFIPAFSDVNTSMTHGSVSVFEPSGSRQELYCDSHQSNLLISPAEIGNFCEVSGGISDPNMATVDLSDKVELDESCAIVNAKSVYGASYRGRNFRYYKKLIKNAFGSHKRLIKEYEHLAILYGDVDKELWQHSESTSVNKTNGRFAERNSKYTLYCLMHFYGCFFFIFGHSGLPRVCGFVGCGRLDGVMLWFYANWDSIAITMPWPKSTKPLYPNFNLGMKIKHYTGRSKSSVH